MKKFLLVLVLLALAMPAMANLVPISFSGHNENVAFNFVDALGNTFNVNNAAINTVQIGANTYAVNGGVLNLTSGADIGSLPTGPTSSLVAFAAGGNLSIFGAVPGKGINVATLLLQGTFANGSATFDWAAGAGNGGNFGGSLIVNFLNSALGLPPINTAADSETNINITFAGPNNYAGTVNDSTVSLQATVPEPGTLAMFGSGLIGIAGVLRRKLKL